MSPERTDGFGTAFDVRTDIYSLAATLYAMLTGKPPFQGATVDEVIEKIRLDAPAPIHGVNAAVAPDFEKLLRHCLGKRTKDRPESAAQMRSALESLAHENKIPL
jgi:eukaryotic-like serine/threonine-protein kinase